MGLFCKYPYFSLFIFVRVCFWISQDIPQTKNELSRAFLSPSLEDLTYNCNSGPDPIVKSAKNVHDVYTVYTVYVCMYVCQLG